MRQPLPRPVSDQDRISLLRSANVVMRHRWLVLGLALAMFGAVVGRALIIDRAYSAYSAFVPQSENGSTNLAGLAAQIGLAIPGGGQPDQSPAFYAALVTSRQVLGTIVDTPFTLVPGRHPVMLVDVFESSGRTPALRREEAIRELGDNLTVSVNQETGMVSLRSVAVDPGLALEINQRILALINEFNLHRRQSRASVERQFTEKRLAEVRATLREAEDREQGFLQRNRDFKNSPDLTFRHERLQREVGLQQQVYGVLAESYERAKIDEVRDTPVITVVERPELPVRPDPRGLLKWGSVALVFGFILGVALAFALEAMARSRFEEPGEFAEFAELKRESSSDLLHPWRVLQRLVRRRRR